MQWRIRALLSGTAQTGFGSPTPWSPPSNTVTMPYNDGSNASKPINNCCFPGHVLVGESCMECPPDTWAGLGASTCEHCAANSSSLAGSGRPSDCVCMPGFFDADLNSSDSTTNCTLCGPGTYTEPGVLGCAECAPGMADMDHNSSTPCDICPTGKFQGISGQLQCLDCASGRFNPHLQQSMCQLCAAGKHSLPASQICCVDNDYAAPGSSVCCPPGSYAHYATSLCLECPSGTQDTDSSAATPCERCTVGRSSLGASARCTACSAGRYSDGWVLQAALEGTMDCSPLRLVACGGFCVPRHSCASLHATCDRCPAGQFTPAAGALDCQYCMPGTFSAGGQTGCTNCTAGLADTDRDAATPCKGCEAGRFATHARALQCSYCPEGDWSDPEATACFKDMNPFRHWQIGDFIAVFIGIPLASVCVLCVLRWMCTRLLGSRYCKVCCNDMGCRRPRWFVMAAFTLGSTVVPFSDVKPEVRFSKAMRRDIALKMGRKWRANARKLAMVNKDCRIPALRAAAGPFKNKAGVDLVHKKYHHKTVIHQVSPEKLERHRLIKKVTITNERRERARKPQLYKDLQLSSAPEIRLNAWAQYHGWEGSTEQIVQQQTAVRQARKRRAAQMRLEAAETERKDELARLVVDLPMVEWSLSQVSQWLGLLVRHSLREFLLDEDEEDTNVQISTSTSATAQNLSSTLTEAALQRADQISNQVHELLTDNRVGSSINTIANNETNLCQSSNSTTFDIRSKSSIEMDQISTSKELTHISDENVHCIRLAFSRHSVDGGRLAVLEKDALRRMLRDTKLQSIDPLCDAVMTARDTHRNAERAAHRKKIEAVLVPTLKADCIDSISGEQWTIGEWLDALELLTNGRNGMSTEGSTREAQLRQYIGWRGGLEKLCDLEIENDDELQELVQGMTLSAKDTAKFRLATRRLQSDNNRSESQPVQNHIAVQGVPLVSTHTPPANSLTAGQKAAAALNAARRAADEAADESVKILCEAKAAEAHRKNQELAEVRAKRDAIDLDYLDDRSKALVTKLPVGIPMRYRWTCRMCGDELVADTAGRSQLEQQAIAHSIAWASSDIAGELWDARACAGRIRNGNTVPTPVKSMI